MACLSKILILYLSINSFKNHLEKRRARQMDFFKDVKSTSAIRLQDWNDKVHVGLDRISPQEVQPQARSTFEYIHTWRDVDGPVMLSLLCRRPTAVG